MANPKVSLSICTLLFITFIILESSSARPLLHSKIIESETKLRTVEPCGEMLSVEGNKHEEKIKKERLQVADDRYKKLGLAFGPSLMNMLPKGKMPVSGPSRRINGANN